MSNFVRKKIINQNLWERDNHQNLQDEKKTNEKKLSWINLIRLTILTRNQTDWADKCSILWFWSFDLKEFEWDFDDDRNKTQLEASSSRRTDDS